MKLDKKKKLAARALGVGLDRVSFNPERLAEIKEAITNQDIKELVKNKVIMIKPVKGRQKIKKKKKNRGPGKIKKLIVNRKREYMILTRNLRKHLRYLLKSKKINKEDYKKLRVRVKSKGFKNKSHLLESIRK